MSYANAMAHACVVGNNSPWPVETMYYHNNDSVVLCVVELRVGHKTILT